MPEVFYRQLIATDHDEYRRVRLDCLKQFPGNFGTTYEEELLALTLKLTNAIQRPDHFNFAFGAFTSSLSLIGICGFVCEKRLKTRHRGEIVQMFVDPLYKGHGIGKKLLQLCIDKAFEHPQIEQIILSAVHSNEKALNLYKQMGFSEYGRLEHYFKSANVYTSQSFLCLMKNNKLK